MQVGEREIVLMLDWNSHTEDELIGEVTDGDMRSRGGLRSILLAHGLIPVPQGFLCIPTFVRCGRNAGDTQRGARSSSSEYPVVDLLCPLGESALPGLKSSHSCEAIPLDDQGLCLR